MDTPVAPTNAASPVAPTNTASPAALKFASFVLRVLALVILVVSLIILCTNTESKTERIQGIFISYDVEIYKIEFIDAKVYQYMLATIVVSIAYFLMQVGLSIYNVLTKSVGFFLLDFYGDMHMSYLLATGAAAGFGVTVDGKKLLDDSGIELGTFYEKVYASESLLLIAFLCTALLSVLSSHALIPKTV